MLITIRAHRETAFSLGALQGVIAFPSFHTVMAILLAYAHRPPSRSFWLVALLNGLMVLAVPPAGHHYLIDAISGALVAVVCIMIIRAGARTTGKHDAAVA
jgi:membrane-associated phospholipid phosphatase